MPPGSTQAAHETSIYNMATFSYLPPSGRYAFSLPTEPVSRAEAAILAEAYARSAAAISARIAGGFQPDSRQEAGFESTTSHNLSARASSAARSDLLREDFTGTSGHASAPALTRRPSPVGVSSRRSVPPNHTPSSMTGKSKEEKAAQSRYGVVMEFDIDPKMPNPHEKPARFARWFRDFFYDMLDMGEGLISGNTFTLLMGLEPNELKDEEPDRFANFALRPNTKLFILKRAANVESMSMTLAGTEVETPCSSCERGRGPYTKCIVVPGMGKGSCSNCRYNGQGTRCSFWSKGEDANFYMTAKRKADIASLSMPEQSPKRGRPASSAPRRRHPSVPASWGPDEYLEDDEAPMPPDIADMMTKIKSNPGKADDIILQSIRDELARTRGL